MYSALSILTGALIAVMIALNGGLTMEYGAYAATVLIHVVGLIFIFLLVAARRERILPEKKLPIYYYLGGAIGVATTVFNNLAFAKISVSAMLALCLLGQSVASMVIDQFGLFKMPKSAFQKKKLIGIAFIILGIVLIMVL